METQQQPKRAIVFGSYIFSLINFRKQLLQDLVSSHYEVMAIAPGHDEVIEKALKDIGVQFRSVGLSRTGFNPFSDLQTLRELIAIFREFRPTLLISYTIKPVIYGNLAAGFFSGIRKLALVTGLGYLDTGERSMSKVLIRRMIHTLYRFALRDLDFIAFQNPDDQEYFRSHRLIPETTGQTITAGSGVDLQHYKRAAPVVSPLVFILIARLIKAKGIHEYIQAARMLKEQYGESVVFQLIGLLDRENPDSIDESELNSAVNENIIDYKGFQKDVRTYLANSSVFVLPSFYREGTPRTALESMAMGKPIITTDNPGCRETVVNNVNGFLVPVRNVQALAEAMRAFVENPSLVTAMGEESFNLARSKFDVRLVNRHLFNFANL